MIYTVLLFNLPANGWSSCQVNGDDANKAAEAAIDYSVKGNMGYVPADFEVIAVARGAVQFEPVDESRFPLFPGF